MDLKVVKKTLKGLKEIKEYLETSYLFMEENGHKLLETVKKTIKELEKNL